MAKLSAREQAAKKAGVAVDYSKSAKQQGKVAPAVKVSSKDRGGLSQREFAAVQAGGKLDYKTGNIIKPKPVTKKVTYNMGEGTATVAPNYTPASTKLEAVKNYSSINDRNYSSIDDDPRRQVAQQKSSFTQNVKTAVKDFGSNLFTKIKGAVGIGSSQKVGVKDVVKELPGAAKTVAKGVGGFAADVARGVFVQAPTTALLSFKEGLTGKRSEYVPQTKIEKAIAGDKPIISVQKRQERGTKIAQDFGLSGGKSVLAGAGLTMGSIAADALPGPGKAVGKGISAAGRKALDAALKAGKSKAEIEAIVRADAKGAFSSIKQSSADAGRAISESTKTPKARAAEFTAADKNASTLADDVVPRGTDEVIPKVSTKKTTERVDVEKAKETVKQSQNRVQKALDDYKKAPTDEFGNVDKDVAKALDDTLRSERDGLKKAYKEATGEDLPDDIEADEVLAKLDKFGADNERRFQLQDGERRSAGEARDARFTDRPVRKEMRDIGSGSVPGKKLGILTAARRNKLGKKGGEVYLGDNVSKTGVNRSETGVNRSGTGLNVSGTGKNTSGTLSPAKETALARNAQKNVINETLDRAIEKYSEHSDDLNIFEKNKKEVEVLTGLKESLKKSNDVRDQHDVIQYLEERGFPVSKDIIDEFQGAKEAIGKAVKKTPQELYGAAAGVQTDENGNVKIDPKMAALGMLGIHGIKKGFIGKKTGSALRNAVDEMATKAQEMVQDNWIRVKKLQEQPDVKVDPNKLSPYEAETLFHGRVGHRLEVANETLQKIDKELADAEKTLKNTNLRSDIDRYLVAKHAPERNAIHDDGAAGMTTAEANDIVKAFEGNPANKPAIEIAKKIKETNDQTLDILRDAQVIDEETYKTLRETYKNHVPLYRVMDEDADMGQVLVNKGYDVRSSGLKRAKGSDKQVDDILSNVASNLEQAIVRAEKNRVNLATLQFARDNKELGLFQEIKPRAIGKTFDDKPILEQINDPLVLSVRENGKPVYLKIKDENLALAFKGIGNEKLPPVLNFISGFTRLYSGLATRFNPEFVLSNKLRDLQEMAVYMSSQKDIGFSGAGKAAIRDSVSIKDVVDGMRGGNSEGARLYKQMMEDGGTTGGQALSTRAQLKLDIEDMRKINRGGILNMRKQGKRLVQAFDSWNQVFEDSTRLSVYKTALDKGLSREKAAIMAKNATINFNKKGTGGPVLNGLYMFANASIQGSTKLIRAMKNPKTAAAVTTAVGGSVWAVNNWNDNVDPQWRDKVSKWDRDSNLVVVLPSDDGGAKYLTLPVSWGLKPMKVMADMAYDASNGHLSEGGIMKGAGKVMASVWDAYNPVGGTDAVSSAVPSFLDIPVEIARNQKWSGSKIRPEDKEGVPQSENFFQNKEGIPSDKSKTFGFLRGATAKIAEKTGGAVQINPANLKYALDGYLSGFGRSITGAIETATAVAKGGLPQASDAPFVRRFYKERTPDEISKTGKYDARDKLYEKLKSVGKDKQAPIIQEYLDNLPAEERKGASYGLFQAGFNTKGTTTSDDVIRMKPLVEKVNKLENEGKFDEVDALVEGLSEDDQKAFKNAMKSMRSKASRELKEQLAPKLDPIATKIVELEKAGKYDESDQLFYGLSEDEQKVIQSLIKNK